MHSTICVTPGWSPRFLVVRHPSYQRNFYDVILNWTHCYFPTLSRLFDVRDLPCAMDDWSSYVLHLPWLQDPVQGWSSETYQHACRLAARCDELGIPIINRVDRLLNASKSVGARLMTAAGVPTPRMAVIRNACEFKDTLLGLSLPLFVREDWGHTGPISRADTKEQARRIELAAFERPVAVELIDVRDPRDGLYRKYRYIAAGNQGVSHHLQISAEWITRGENRVVTDVTRDEELAYIGRQDPNHELLQRARAALDLEFLAFDYGYTREGQLIVWEANPFPLVQFSTKALKYRNAALHRTMLAILKMYLERASLSVPNQIQHGLAYRSPAS